MDKRIGKGGKAFKTKLQNAKRKVRTATTTSKAMHTTMGVPGMFLRDFVSMVVVCRCVLRAWV